MSRKSRIAVREEGRFIPDGIESVSSSVAFFHEPSNTVYVSFDKDFELSKPDYNYFSMHKRKCFSKAAILEQITTVMNELFSKSEEFLERYASLRILIADHPELSVEEFNRRIKNMIPYIVPIADEFVRANYIPAAEEQPAEEAKSKKGRKNNTELQFTADHSIMLLRVSFAIKAILPLILEYCTVHPELNFDSVYLDTIEPCFTCDPDNEEIDILNKIFKIIDSRVKSTKYSDKVIWKFMRSYSINSSTVEQEFFRKILIEIIPKLEYRDCISFLHVTVKFLIQYLFRYKFPLNFYPINLSESRGGDSGNDLSNLEHLEFNLVRIDESDGAITEAKLHDMLMSIMNDKDYKISPEEYQYYKKNVQINTVQTQLLFLFLSKRVGRMNSLYNLKFSQYIFVLIYFKKWLEKNGFNYLSRWILMTFENTDRRSIDLHEFTAGLLKSKRFTYLNQEKYKHMISSFTRNNIITKLISAIFSHKGDLLLNFEEDLKYTEFAEQYEGGRENPAVKEAFIEESKIRNLSSYNIMAVSDEILRLIESI